MSARLHVFLGQGGVGKTTLAASTALALARQGRRVGLLGVDPSGRLRDALGMTSLSEREAPVRGIDNLHAAILRPGESLRRWASEELGGERAELLRNPFFEALADRLAAATDALAAVRIAEWIERDPGLDDLVLDTAPGLNGIELLTKPDRLLALLNGRLLRWLGMAASAAMPERAGRRVLRALSRIGGMSMVRELGEFSLLIERLAAAMVNRLKQTQAWFHRPDTRLLLVCASSPGATEGARSMAASLIELGLQPTSIVLNRALHEGMAPPPQPPANDEERAFLRFLAATLELQQATRDELARTWRVIEVPMADSLENLDALAGLGRVLLREVQGLRANPARTGAPQSA